MAGVTIKGLWKRYGAETAAVSDLDLVVRDNSFVTLLGPSGCGKTTTLRLIAGYMPARYASRMSPMEAMRAE